MIILSITNMLGINAYRISAIGKCTTTQITALTSKLPAIIEQCNGELIPTAIAVKKAHESTYKADFRIDLAVDLHQYTFVNDESALETATKLYQARLYCTTQTNYIFFKLLLTKHFVRPPLAPIRPTHENTTQGLFDTFKKGDDLIYGLKTETDFTIAQMRNQGLLHEHEDCRYSSFFSKYQILGLLTHYGFSCKPEKEEENYAKIRIASTKYESDPIESREYKALILAHLLNRGTLYFVVDNIMAPSSILKELLSPHDFPTYRKQITASELSYTSKLRASFPDQVIYVDQHGNLTPPPWENPQHKFYADWCNYWTETAKKTSHSSFFARRHNSIAETASDQDLREQADLRTTVTPSS